MYTTYTTTSNTFLLSLMPRSLHDSRFGNQWMSIPKWVARPVHFTDPRPSHDDKMTLFHVSWSQPKVCVSVCTYTPNLPFGKVGRLGGRVGAPKGGRVGLGRSMYTTSGWKSLCFQARWWMLQDHLDAFDIVKSFALQWHPTYLPLLLSLMLILLVLNTQPTTISMLQMTLPWRWIHVVSRVKSCMNSCSSKVGW